MNFNDFCYKILNGMYEPRLPYENQCTGYKKLREMVEKQIKPATKKQYEKWYNNPTLEVLSSVPDIKYLTFLHELVRPIIRKNWNMIRKLSLN